MNYKVTVCSLNTNVTDSPENILVFSQYTLTVKGKVDTVKKKMDKLNNWILK
ncbi:MAG: hypothetical protein QXY76_06400 [Nitrososphaeria archaeon]